MSSIRNITVTGITPLSLLVASTAVVAQGDNTEELLRLSLEELVNTTVTIASKQPQRASEAASIVTAISRRQILESGARTLRQLFDTVPGFTALHQIAAQRLLVVRGAGLADGVLIQIDGVTVNDAFNGSFEFYERPVGDIERIEIIRGPGSALYGGYALTAIVQITTRRYEEGSVAELTLGGGSNSLVHASAYGQYALEFGGRSLTVAASFTYSDDEGESVTLQQDNIFTPGIGTFLSPLTNPSLTPASRDEAEEKFNSHVKIDYGDLQLAYQMSQILSEPLLSSSGLVVEEDKLLREVTLHRLSARQQWAHSETSSSHVLLYAVGNRYKLLGQTEPPQYLGDENQDGRNEEWPSGVIEAFEHTTLSIGASFETQMRLAESHTLIGGVVLDETRLEDVSKHANISLAGRGPRAIFPFQDMTHEFMPEDVNRRLTAVYIQDLWQLSERSTLTAGFRYDDYSDFGSTGNPRLGLVHRFDGGWYAKALYGEAYKPPGFLQLFDLTPTLSPFRVQGNADLKATEISTSEIQLGIEWSSVSQASINLFHNTTENEIFFNNTPGIDQWQNGQNRDAKGLEIEYRGSLLERGYFFVNYAWQDSEGIDSGPQADIHAPHRLNLGGFQRLLGDRLGLYSELSYLSAPDREAQDNREKVDSALLWNATLSARDVIPNLDIKLRVDNILDEDRRDETHAALGLLEDVPGGGRTFWLSIEYRWQEQD